MGSVQVPVSQGDVGEQEIARQAEAGDHTQGCQLDEVGGEKGYIAFLQFLASH